MYKRQLFYVYVTFILCTGSMAPNAFSQGVQPLMSTSVVRLAYLMNNSVWVGRLNKAETDIEVESEWNLPNEEKRKNYAALTCAPQGKLGAHVSVLTGDPNRPVRTEIVTLDLQTKTITPVKVESSNDLLWPVWAPNGKRLAATTRRGDLDAAAVVELPSGKVKVFSFEKSIAPYSWQGGSEKILATTLDGSGKRWESVSIDLKSAAISPLFKGGRPISAGQSKKIATIPGDLSGLTIYDGTQSTQLKGQFRELIRWMDESTILAIVSVRLRDRLALIDTKSGAIRTFGTSEPGEINGVCVFAGK